MQRIALSIVTISLCILSFIPLSFAIATNDLQSSLSTDPMLASRTPTAPKHTETNEHEETASNTATSTGKAKTTNKSTSASHSKKSSQSATVEHPATSASKQPLQTSKKEYAAILNKYFAEWTGGSDELTRAQILTIIENTKIYGQEAAVLGSIVVQMSNSSQKKFTLKQLKDELNNKNGNLYYYYQTGLGNINGVRALHGSTDKLWGPTGSLSANTQIIQQSDDDCYLLSAINSMLLSDPQKLQAMITPEGDDRFKVKFPGDPVAEHVRITDAEIAMYSTLAKGGEWLAVISVAEAKRRVRLHLDPEITMQPGYQTQTLSLLTGKEYKLWNLPNSLSAEQQQKLINMILAALDNKPYPTPIGIETSVHDLSIIGYANGQVEIKNPWGTSGWYNPRTAGSSSSKTEPTSKGPWYLMKNGVFYVPMADITNGFTDIAFHPQKDTDITSQPTVQPVTAVQPETPAQPATTEQPATPDQSAVTNQPITSVQPTMPTTVVTNESNNESTTKYKERDNTTMTPEMIKTRCYFGIYPWGCSSH